MGKQSEGDPEIHVPQVHGLKARKLEGEKARRLRIMDRIKRIDRILTLSLARPAQAGLEPAEAAEKD